MAAGFGHAAALQPGKRRRGSAGAVGSRLSFLFSPQRSGWKTAGRAFLLLFCPLGSFPRAKGGAAGVRPDGAVGGSGAARRGAEAPPGRGSRQRALLFRRRRGARLCPAAAGCGPARALSAPNRTSAQSGAGFSIPTDFLSFFSFLFPPFLFSVN